MAEVAFSSITNEIAMDAPGCPDFLIAKELKNAAIQFCEESEVYTHAANGNLSIGNSEYSPTLPNSTRAVFVKKVKVDGVPIKAITEGDAFKYQGPTSGKPVYFYEKAGAISLIPTPNNTYSIDVYLALKPTRTATGIEEHIFEDWSEAISQLALFNLTAMPERTWTSPQIAQKALMVYQDQLKKAKARADGRVNVKRKVRFSW